MLVDTGEIAQIENPSRQMKIGTFGAIDHDEKAAICWLADAMESGALFEFDWTHPYGNKWRIAWEVFGRKKSLRLSYYKDSNWIDSGGFDSLANAADWLKEQKNSTKNGVSVYVQLMDGLSALPYGNTQPMEKILTRC